VKKEKEFILRVGCTKEFQAGEKRSEVENFGLGSGEKRSRVEIFGLGSGEIRSEVEYFRLGSVLSSKAARLVA